MEKQDLKRIWMAAMLLVLVATAPSWLNPQEYEHASYSAPWIYPALEPPAQ